jgi:hypothetical protein
VADFRKVLDENPKGRLEFVNDELKVISKVHEGKTDAAKLRLESENDPVIGGISIGRPGSRDERFLLTGDTGDGWKFQVSDGRGTADENMRAVATVRLDGARYTVPVIGPNLAIGTGGKGSGVWFSDDGRTMYNTQSDATPEFPHGRIVVYDVTGSTPVAVGFIRVESL